MTRRSLLLRVRNPSDQQAWEEFVETYRPKIVAWCQQRRLQRDDAEEIAQQILVKLVTGMRGFEYDPRGPRRGFRAWLKVVTQRAIIDAARGNRRWTSLASPEQMPDRESLSEDLSLHIQQDLIGDALDALRPQLAGTHDWKVFQATALAGGKVGQVAGELGMSANAVSAAKMRVMKKIRQWIEQRLRETEGAGES